jgi:hypothetical protein
MYKVRCPHCGYSQATRESSIGSIQRCRACGEKIFIKEARMGILGWMVLFVAGGAIWYAWPSRSSAPPPPAGPAVPTAPVSRPVVTRSAPTSPLVAAPQPVPAPVRPSLLPPGKKASAVPSTADVVKRNLEKTKKALKYYTPTINTSRYGEKASNSP